MKNAVIEVTVTRLDGEVQPSVYIHREGRGSRLYSCGYHDEKCISLASVRRAMRLQAKLLGVQS